MPLNVKPDQSRLTTLLTDTVVLLCKNGLNFNGSLRIVGVLGITIDDSDVFIVHLNENVSSVTPDATSSYGNSGEKPKGFHGEKRVVPYTPRSGKSLGRPGVRPTDDVQRVKGLTQTEDGTVKADLESDHECEIVIKEEKMETMEMVERKQSCGRVEDEGGTQGGARREKRTYRWSHEIGHVSISDPNDRVDGTSEDREAPESRAGMDEWNLDMLALSSLPGNGESDGGVPPWPGYVWGGGGGGYAQDGLSVELSHVQSQSMVSARTRSALEDLTQPDVERHGFAMMKPFACPVVGCTRRFYHRNNVYRHRKQKHGENILGLTNRRR